MRTVDLLPFAIPVVASLALLVSIASWLIARSSLKLARAIYERAGPKLDFHTRWDEVEGRSEYVASVQLFNSGLASISLERFHVTVSTTGRQERTLSRQDISAEWIREGDPLPVLLPPQTSARWVFVVPTRVLHVMLLDAPLTAFWPNLLSRSYRSSALLLGISLDLGNGEVIRAGIRTRVHLGKKRLLTRKPGR